MAFPVIQTSSHGGDSTQVTSHSVTLPTGIVSGNLLLLFFSNSATPADPGAGTATGWTSLVNFGYQPDANWLHGTILWRIANGTEGASVTVTSPGAAKAAYVVHRIDTWNSASTPAVSTQVTGTTVNPDPAALSPSWGAADTLWVSAVMMEYINSASAVPTNYSNLVLGQSSATTASSAVTANRALNAASENPGTFTIANAFGWLAYTVAVEGTGGSTASLFRRPLLNGLGSGGPFFNNPLG